MDETIRKTGEGTIEVDATKVITEYHDKAMLIAEKVKLQQRIDEIDLILAKFELVKDDVILVEEII